MWCVFIKPVVMLKKLYCALVLLGNNKLEAPERLEYLFKLLLAFGPVAFMLNAFDLWYQENQSFFNWVLGCIMVNMVVGIRFHMKMKTFSWKEFLIKNSEMICYTILVYFLLEALRSTAGDSQMGEYFKIIVQLTTLLFPISKAIKNIHLLTDKKHPPAFIMNKFYNYEKTGDVRGLFGDNKKNEEDGHDNTGTN